MQKGIPFIFRSVPSGPGLGSFSKNNTIIVVTDKSFCIKTQLFILPSAATEKKFISPSGKSGAHFTYWQTKFKLEFQLTTLFN